MSDEQSETERRTQEYDDARDEEYWFSAKTCFVFGCGGNLKKATRRGYRVLYCTKCGAVTAAMEIKK